MIDVVLGAGVFEGVRPNELSSLQGGLDVWRRRARVAWRREVGSAVGEDRVNLVKNGRDQAAQEVARSATRHLLVHLDEGELRHSVDGDDEAELALRSSMRSAPLSKAAKSFRPIPNNVQNSCWLIPREVRLMRTRLPIHINGRCSCGGIHIDRGLQQLIGFRQDPSCHCHHSLRLLNATLQP
jgi:hypothetical protein